MTTEKVSKAIEISILPYTAIVGQTQIKLALELAYISPRIGGVLISGQRGTGKSTLARSFHRMMSPKHVLPVTLPINATEDRVVGGWKIDELMQAKAVRQPGLLEEAGQQGMLYVDEVNLLDDHIVNIILDVTSTGILVVQREGQREEMPLSFTLVGTMNPEEGGLRPQLLDRFGLMVSVGAEQSEERRAEILQTVLEFEQAKYQLAAGQPADFIEQGRKNDKSHCQKLKDARQRLHKQTVAVPKEITTLCVKLANAFEVEGHRGDYVMALAAQAKAALDDVSEVTPAHLEQVTPLAIQHRRRAVWQSDQKNLWDIDRDEQRLREILYG